MLDAGDRRPFRREAEIRAEARIEVPAPRGDDVRQQREERMSGEKKMNVASFERSKRTPDPARVAEFSATARKLLRERGSGDVIARLLRETPRAEWPRIAENAE